MSDGLASSTVFAIRQDTEGYLWLGTRLGLERFDGTMFTKWSTATGFSLPVGAVTALAASPDGGLWIGFGSPGSVSYRGRARTVNYPPGTVGTPDSVTALLIDTTGVVWCGTASGLARFTSGRWEQIGASTGLPRAGIAAIHEAHGTLFVATSSGLFHRQRDGSFAFVSSDIVTSFADDPDGRTWVATRGRALRTLPTASHPQTLTLSAHAAVRRLFADSSGLLWVGTTRGLSHLTVTDGIPHLQVLRGHDGLEAEEILSFTQDGDGNVWVGSRQGLRRFFQPRISLLSNADDLKGSSTGAITTTPDGTVWVATNSGVTAFSESSRTPFWYDTHGVTVTALHGDTDGTAWAGTQTQVLQLSNGAAVEVPVPPGALRGPLFAIRPDGAGGLWLCHGALSRWRDGTVRDVAGTTEGGMCAGLASDSHNRLWISFLRKGVGTYIDGEFRWHPEAGRLPPGPVSAIYVDAADNVWMGTFPGVSRIQAGHLVTVDGRNGLPGTNVTALVDDTQGTLWLANSAGLISIAKSEFDAVSINPHHQVTYALYDSSDGLSDGPEWGYHPTAARDRSGRLWFHTVGGAAIVVPSHMPLHQGHIQIRIDGVQGDGTPVVPHRGRVTIVPRVRTVHLEYSALSLSAASKLRFRYLLDGFDKTWVTAGTRRYASYTALPPGHYTFRVQAEMNSAPRAQATLAFTVLPPFYQRAWFLAACAFVSIAMGWGAWRLRVHRLTRDFMAVTEERSRIAREVHDTVLQSMVSVAMQLGALEKQMVASSHGAVEQLRRVESRLKQYIRDARQSVLLLRSDAPTRPLSDGLRDFIEDLAQEGRQGVCLRVSGARTTQHPGAERELLRIAQEALRNALDHGQATSIHVDVEYATASIHLRITDDGCGFDADSHHPDPRHWGLMGMKERASELGGHLTIRSRRGRGTEVDVVVPLESTV